MQTRVKSCSTREYSTAAYDTRCAIHVQLVVPGSASNGDNDYDYGYNCIYERPFQPVTAVSVVPLTLSIPPSSETVAKASSPGSEPADSTTAPGGAGPALRNQAHFVATPLFVTVNATDNGLGAVNFTAPDNIGTFVVRAYAATGGRDCCFLQTGQFTATRTIFFLLQKCCITFQVLEFTKHRHCVWICDCSGSKANIF